MTALVIAGVFLLGVLVGYLCRGVSAVNRATADERHAEPVAVGTAAVPWKLDTLAGHGQAPEPKGYGPPPRLVPDPELRGSNESARWRTGGRPFQQPKPGARHRQRNFQETQPLAPPRSPRGGDAA